MAVLTTKLKGNVVNYISFVFTIAFKSIAYSFLYRSLSNEPVEKKSAPKKFHDFFAPFQAI